MNAEVKDKWIAALESGEYVQGTGLLNYKKIADETPKLCCLGVLCELAVAEGITTSAKKNWTEGDSWETVYGDSWASAYLPPEVIEWSGLPDHTGTLAGATRNLAQLNDQGATFADIAEVIREQF